MAEKSGDTATTTTTMEKLPQDLVVNTLSRLSAPHLWPLRSVSKLWFQLIVRNPQFAKLIFDRSKSNPSFILALGDDKSSNEDKEKFDFYLATNHTECDKAVKLNLPFVIDCYNVYCVCNGMLCLSDYEKHEVYIWNPLTNDHITIPYPVTPLRLPKNYQSTIFGFCYVESANEYNVIKVVSEGGWARWKYSTELSVYTLGKDTSWRIIMEDLPYFFTFKGIPCPQMDGKFMWIAKRDGEFPAVALVFFDLEDESLSEVLRPPIQDRSDLTSILDLGGSLCVFNATRSKGVVMWMMKLDGEICAVDKPVILGRPEVFGDFSVLVPLGVVASSGDILVVKNQRGLITYNLSTKSINHLKKFCCPIVNAIAFAGSIISPRAINGVGRTLEARGL